MYAVFIVFISCCLVFGCPGTAVDFGSSDVCAFEACPSIAGVVGSCFD